MELLNTHAQEILKGAAIAGGAVLLGILIHFALFRLLRRVGGHLSRLRVPDGLLLERTRAPALLVLPLICLYLVQPLITEPLTEDAQRLVAHALYIGMVVALTWLAIRTSEIVNTTVGHHLDVDRPDNLRARRIQTQIAILRRIIVVAILVVAATAILIRFDQFKQLGTGILASAGILGIIIGIAAQRPLSNLLAGFQIAMTQPIRVDDVVVVEGEWGRIEEITLTYVVVRIWDLRRLVLPISYFVENPIQNWTRISADLLGTAFFYVDYTVPVDEMREQLRRILEGSDRWDGKVWALQVTDTNERTVQVRALMSAPDASTAFELRCEVREKMIAYLQEHHPGSLPLTRAELHEAPDASSRKRDGAMAESSNHASARSDDGGRAEEPTS